MPSMSRVEQAFCRSVPWRVLTDRVVLPWALAGVELDGDVLEIGGGGGYMAQGMGRLFPQATITVTDIDPTMVRAAQKRLKSYPNLTAQQADVTALPFPDQSFDHVACFLMLHHVIDWPRAVAEAARVLRPGGSFVGYDLADTRFARLIHFVDRSPHQLIRREEFLPAFKTAGLQPSRAQHGLARQVVRFAASSPREKA